MKDMKEMQERVDKVHESIVKEEKVFNRSLTKTMLFYVAIVIILAGYTVYLNIKIQELATPRNLAITINSGIKNMIPRFTQNLKTEMEPNAKHAAKKSIGMIYSGIPYVKEMLKSQVNIYVNKIANDMEEEHMVKFEAVIDEALNKAIKNKDLAKDKNLGKAIATQISDDLDKELAKIIDKPFIDAIDKFRIETEALRTKPISKLTRKELAEKTFIATWIYLVNNKAPDKGIFSKVIQLVNETSKNLQDTI